MEKGNLVNQYEINTKRELKFFWQQKLFDFIPDRKNKTDSSMIIASRVTIQWRIQDFRKGGGHFFLLFNRKGGVILQKQKNKTTINKP